MSDVAALGFAIDSSQAVKATGDLDKLSASATRLQTTADKTGVASKGLASDQRGLATEAQRAAAQFSNATPIHEKHTQSIRSQRMQIRALAEAFGNSGSQMSELINRSGLLFIATQHVSVSAIALVVVLGTIALAVRSAVAAYSELEKAQAKVGNALAATNVASGQTVKSFDDLVRGIAHSGTQSIADVRAAASELLKFRNISSETFENVLKGATDLAATGFADLKTAVAALGKAFSDPTKAGVEFESVGLRLSVAQQRLATDLSNTGRVAQAQSVLWKALQEQVGGANAKSADTLSAAYARLEESFKPILESLGQQIAKAVGLKEALDGLTHAIDDAAKRQGFWASLNQLGRSLVAGAEGRPVRNAPSTVPLPIQAGVEDLDAMIAKYKAATEQARLLKERFDGVSEALRKQGLTAGMTAQQIEVYHAAQEAGVEGDKRATAALAALINARHAAEFSRQTTDQIKQQTGAIAIETATIFSAIGPATAYRVEQEKLLEAQIKGIALSPQQLKNIHDLAEAQGKAAAALDQLKKINEMGGAFVSGFLTDLSHGVKTIDALKNALTRLSDTLIDMISRKLVAQALGGLMGSFGGGAMSVRPTPDTIGPFAMGHTGGIVGQLTQSRYIHPAYFDNAPHFARGGIVGNEVPVIAHRGERISTPEQWAAQGRGGGDNHTYYIDASGADSAAISRLQAALMATNAKINFVDKNSLAHLQQKRMLEG